VSQTLPSGLQEIVDRFAGGSRELRKQGLLQYGKKLPPLPESLREDRDDMEQVHECQTAFFLHTDVEEDGTVRIHFDCPPEAPTVRGYAGILHAGLDGATVDEILGIPDEFYQEMGLAEVVSPMRLRGMGAIVARLKRQVRDKARAA
jgi:cysteine desulfuration protein SufE